MKHAAIVVLLALSGCASGTGGKALEVIAPLAAKVLRAAAEQKGVALDEAGAMCVPIDMSAMDLDVPGVAAMCWAPELE